jgi:uncharacterized protein YndB with AHSA1/START domain
MDTEKIVIKIEADINASIDKVWKYWNDPAHMTHWNYASTDWHCPWATNDLQIGGKFVARMEAKDGSVGFDFSGVYDEIEFQQKIVYSMEDGRIVKISFSFTDGKTNVKIHFDAETENPIELQQVGWQSILNNFKKHCESDL